jgi:hypothetical protein
MDETVITYSRFARRPQAWQKFAQERGPVFIKDRGEIRYVLTTHEHYEALARKPSAPGTEATPV